MATSTLARANQFRIIGGEWRGRKLCFPDVPDLRPTPDRVRETLFNWLMPSIQGALCLDLFAGSGALGLEALSRGAKKTVFVDKVLNVTQALNEHLARLKATDKAEVQQADGLKYLQGEAIVFDVIFLDPPYQSNFLVNAIPLLEQGGWLTGQSLLYLEHAKQQQRPNVLANWRCLKEKKAGDVHYYLFQKR